MAYDIGPKIGIEGEKEFKKAISNINNEFKLLSSEMKLAVSQFDQNDKSTEALTARNQVLGKEIDAQKSKISILTTQYDRQNAVLSELEKKLTETTVAFGADSAEVVKAQSEYDKQANKVRGLETDLNKAKSGLNDMDRALAENNKKIATQESSWTKLGKTLEDIGSKLEAVGKKMTSVGKDMTMKITTPIVAGATACVAAFKAVDVGADAVIKATGATGEAAKELESIYKEVASSVPDSFEDVGNAVGEINTRLGFTGDALKIASEDFLKFARINDMDVKSSVELVSRAMGDAGIESNQYKSVLDMLTVAAQKSGISMESLTTNLTKYGAPMRALGIDTETSIAMFAGWEKAGVNTEIAFSGMKKAIGNWGKEGKDSTVEFKKTLEAIKSAPDISAATSMAIEVFGQKAGPDLADAIQGGRFEINDYIDALEKAGGSVDDTYNQITDGTDDAKAAFNSIKIAASELGDVIINTLAPYFQDFSEKIKAVSEWFTNLSPQMQDAVLIVAGLAAAIGPVLVIAGTLVSSIGAITTAFGAASVAIEAAGGVMAVLTGPIATVIAAISGIVLAGILLYENWDLVKEKAEEVWTEITNIFNTVIEFVQTNWQSLLLLIVNPIGGAVKLLYDLNPKFKEWINGLLADFKEWIVGFVDIGKKIVEGIWEGIKNAKDWFMSQVKGFFKGIIKGAKEALGIASPSKVFAEIGSYMAQGLGVGFTSEMSDITKKINNSIPTDISMSGNYNNGIDGLSNNATGSTTTTNQYYLSLSVNADKIQQMTDIINIFDNWQQVINQGGAA